MDRTEIRISGFGGQGVVLLAYIFGRACAIESGRHATMIQSFGPEARGSSCSATLAISDTEVLYPYIGRPQFLVAMSSEAYDKFHEELSEDGTLIYEENLVQTVPDESHSSFSIPSTRIAETLGRAIVQNMVMLGFVTAVTRIVEKDEMRAAVKDSVPPGTEELNLAAFDAGWAHFEATYGEVGEKASKEPRAVEAAP